MKLSLGSWAGVLGPYKESPISIEEMARSLAAAGFDGIEVFGQAPHVSLDLYPTKESRRQFKRMLGDLGLEVSGYSADLRTINPALPGRGKPYIDLFKRNTELVKQIGGPSIRADTGTGPEAAEDSSVFGRVAEIWYEAAEIAEDAGIRLLWEFEPGYAFNKPSEILEMHQRVGHRSFKLLFDTSHAYLCGVAGARQLGDRETLPGGLSEFLELVHGRIGGIHVIDTDGTLRGDGGTRHTPFGEGSIDFDEITPALVEVRDVEWWCLDLCCWPDIEAMLRPTREYAAGLLKVRG